MTTHDETRRYNRILHTADASCPRCRARDGEPKHDSVGNIGRLEMGHRMYHMHDGPTAACILPKCQSDPGRA